MVSGVAHELNNPLSVVKGYLELVPGPPQSAARRPAPTSRRPRTKATRAAKLVMNFLSLAREQPALLLRKSVNLNELVQRIVDPAPL